MIAKATLSNRHGIALREMIVVFVILAVLLMMLLMWLGRTSGESRRILCEQRQQQTAAAMIQFESLQNHYPGYKNLQAVDATDQRQPTGWVFGLLPLIAAKTDDSPSPYAALFEKYGPAGGDATRGLPPQERIAEIQCPSDPAIRAAANDVSTENAISWVVNTGMPDAEDFGELPADWTANGMFENQFDEGAALAPTMSSQWLLDHDGLASTLMLTENVDAGTWTDFAEPLVGFVWVAEIAGGQPARGKRLLAINVLRGEGDGSVRYARPSSYHAGGVNAVFASGKTQFLSDNIDWLVFTQLMTSDGANAMLPGTEKLVPAVYR